MSSLVMSLLVIELMLTLAGITVYFYRTRLELNEENTLILTDAEAHLLDGQAEIHARVKRLGVILKYVGIAWAVFGLALLGVWLGEGLGLL